MSCRPAADDYAAPDIGIAGCRLLLEMDALLHSGPWIRPDDCWGHHIGALLADLGHSTEDREVEGNLSRLRLPTIRCAACRRLCRKRQS